MIGILISFLELLLYCAIIIFVAFCIAWARSGLYQGFPSFISV